MLLNKFNMKRYKVGEVFEYEGMILKAVEDHFNQVDRGCKCCALRKLPWDYLKLLWNKIK